MKCGHDRYFNELSNLKKGDHIVTMSPLLCKKIKNKGSRKYRMGHISTGTLCRVLKQHDAKTFDLIEECDAAKDWNIKIEDGAKFLSTELESEYIRVLTEDGYKTYVELLSGHKIRCYPVQLCKKCNRVLRYDEYDLGHCPGGCPDGIPVYETRYWYEETPYGETKHEKKVMVSDGNNGRGYPRKKECKCACGRTIGEC